MSYLTNHHQQEQKASSLSCDIKILRAKNLEFLSSGSIFVRCYLVAGNGTKIRLNSPEIESTSYDPCWNEHFSLECRAHNEAMEELRHQKVVFELRWRSCSPVIGRVVGSKILGRQEIAWTDVIEAEGKQMERWVSFTPTGRLPVGLKPPAVQLGMRVREGTKDTGKVDRRRRLPAENWKECGCTHGSCNDIDEEIFAIAAALELM